MAAKRSIPTTLFASPDFFELSTDTIRLILIGIILDADDEGRGSAHPRLLARKLDKRPEDIDVALAELEAHGILRCYEVSGRVYYVLLHWHKYQVLSRPTSSNFPPPPQERPTNVTYALGISEQPRAISESPGEPFREEEGEGEGERKEEQEEKRNEDEGITPPGRNDVSPSTTNAGGDVSPSLKEKSVEIDRVAFYLQLPMTTDLQAIVGEFADTPTLSLIGEAIEARSWVDDPRRNRKGQQMTPAFYRRWLKRSRGDYTPEQKSVQAQPLAFRASSGERSLAKGDVPTEPPINDPYQEYFLHRLAEVKAHSSQKQEVVA